MKRMLLTRACSLAGFFLPVLLAAQTSAPPPAPNADETVQLTPFEVNSSRDVGYTATSALAGGRIDTPLANTPSAITVLTKEFLDDIGVTTFSQAAEWAPNAVPSGQTSAFGEYNVNLRGIGSSFPSRNYFRWYIDSDSYNTERLEFARGPNSILFGDGNVGGVSTTWTKRPLFAPRRGIQLRADSFGGYRATLDVNQPVSDRAALRVNALYDRGQGWRDRDEPRRDGVHIATALKLTDATQFRAEGEWGEYRRYIFAQNFSDQSSNWDRTTVYNGVTAPSTAGTGVSRLNGGVNDDFLVYDASQPNLGVLNWRGFYRSNGTGLRLLPQGRPINRFPSLPSREFSLQPPDAYVTTDYSSWTFYLEHRFSPALAAQLAFNHQAQSRVANEGTWTDHRIDINTVLPNGQPNPNFGKAFHDVNPTRQIQENALNDWRLSLAYRKNWSWLKESVSGILGRRQDEFNLYTFRLSRTNGTNPDAHASTNQLFIRQYWDRPINPARPDGFTAGGSSYGFVSNNVIDEDQELTYAQIASASSLLDDRLHVLLGFRRDYYERVQRRRVAANPNGTPIIGGTNGPGGADATDLDRDTVSAGAVWYAFRGIGPFVNYSESFNAAGAGDPLIDNRTPDPSSNEGIDVGLKFTILDNRVSGSVSYYQIKQIGRTRSGSNRTDINEIWADMGRLDLQIPNFRDLETFEGEGYELDMTANLTRGWRMLLNISFPETSQIDIGSGLKGYYNANIATWRAAGNDAANPNAARIRQNITDIERTIQGFTEGRALNNTYKYLANVYTTYAFQGGALRGWAVGGGANFRGRNIIGNVNGQPFNYLRAGAYHLLSAHVSHTRKFGDVRARFQLNVNNLLDEDSLIRRSYSFQNALGGDFPNDFSYIEPRKFTFSASFDF